MHTFISNNKKKERRTNMESNKNNVSFVTGVHTHDTTRGGGAKPVVEQEDNTCICGEYELDNAGPDCYSHMTQGY